MLDPYHVFLFRLSLLILKTDVKRGVINEQSR